jgi:hypothetical protein
VLPFAHFFIFKTTFLSAITLFIINALSSTCVRACGCARVDKTLPLFLSRTSSRAFGSVVFLSSRENE